MKSHCPYCDYTAEVRDPNPNAEEEARLLARLEINHMNAEHPEIVLQRLADAGLGNDPYKFEEAKP
jgi:hypothetical protein